MLAVPGFSEISLLHQTVFEISSRRRGRKIVAICLQVVLLLPLHFVPFSWSSNICVTGNNSGTFSPDSGFQESPLILMTVADYQKCFFSFSSVNRYRGGWFTNLSMVSCNCISSSLVSRLAFTQTIPFDSQTSY